MAPDKDDMRMLDVLRADSSLSIRNIALKTKIPATTVHSRIRKMKKNGIIKRFTVELDMAKIGRPVSAFILMNANPKYLRAHNIDQEHIADELVKHPLVEKVSSVTGRFDFIMHLRVKDIAELNNYIMKVLRQHEGIQRTETFVELYQAEGK